jgi:hypothetical protein
MPATAIESDALAADGQQVPLLGGLKILSSQSGSLFN